MTYYLMFEFYGYYYNVTNTMITTSINTITKLDDADYYVINALPYSYDIDAIDAIYDDDDCKW